jgi:hypothetical protein
LFPWSREGGRRGTRYDSAEKLTPRAAPSDSDRRGDSMIAFVVTTVLALAALDLLDVLRDRQDA